jgi:hypothetical protein
MTTSGLAAEFSNKGKSVKKRVVIIANKNWEAAPLMDVLLEPRACPPGFPWPRTLNHTTSWQAASTPKTADDIANPKPRAIFEFKETLPPVDKESAGVEAVTEVEVWCLQDWMAPPPVSSSSSFEKIRVLPQMFNWTMDDGAKAPPPDFVVAFGTAGFPTIESSYNGCVVIGANTYIFNPLRDSPNPASPWDDSKVKRPILPTFSKTFFTNTSILDDALRAQVEARMIAPPMKPAEHEILIAAYNYTAVGAVNITNYDDYAWADPKAIEEFKAADPKNPVGSIETTHALIRIQSDAQFMFVSGITDREGALSAFNMEVSTRVYSQNFAAAHNAGVVTAWLMPRIAHFVATSEPSSPKAP